jgi:hypothetical protein
MTDDIAEVKRRVRELTLRLIRDRISDKEQRAIGEELSRIVPDPAYTEYVFYPKEDGPTIEDTVDRAIEKAFNYKPIIL